MVTEESVTAGAIALAKRNNASNHEPFMGIARAVLEAALSASEPVAHITPKALQALKAFGFVLEATTAKAEGLNTIPLYAAPPAPSVAFNPEAVSELLSALESLQRENEELRKDRYNLAYAITGGEDAPGLLDSTPTSEIVEIAQHTHRIHSADIDRAEAAEAEVKRFREALQNLMGCYDTPLSRRRFPPDAFMTEALDIARTALASTGGEHHA